MAEREVKKGSLELSLSFVNRWDVLRLEHGGADKKNSKKVGEMDIYECNKEGVGGVVFYKEVFDNKGNLKAQYLSMEEKIVAGTESLKLKCFVGVTGGYVYIDNKRVVKDG